MPSLRTKTARKDALPQAQSMRLTRSQSGVNGVRRMVDPSSRPTKVTKMAPKPRPNRGQATALLKAIQAITDYKIVRGTVFYYVRREGTRGNVWEPADSIDATDPVLKAFHQQVEGSGYNIGGIATNDNVNGRPSRLSKTRAILRLKPAGEEEIDSDSDHSVVLVKSSNPKKRTRAGGIKTPKKPRGILARKAAEANARDQRKSERTGFDDAAIVEMDDPECCLRCNVHQYRRAVANDDVEQLTALIADKNNIPSWSEEECQHRCDYVAKEAAIMGNKVIVEMLLRDHVDPKKQKRVKIPTRYKTYDSNTGFVSRYTFGHAVSQVNESRGNRQGNSAFFRNEERIPLDVDMAYLSVKMTDTCFLSAMQEGRITDDMAEFLHSVDLDGYINRFWEGAGFYFCVASGNWSVAGSLIKSHVQSDGFNHLHIQVLNHDESKPLDTYRKNQILKRSYGAFNITPLFCAAIHPSRKFFAELYEALTTADRVVTDRMGRSVAHFAAVSSTPDCLEYLIEQEFGFRTGDKSKLTPLVLAARYGRYRNIRPLVTYLSGGKYPSTEHADHTLLRMRFRPLHYAAFNGHPETCRALIDAGATVDAPESTLHASPLSFAAQRGHLECVKVLIEHGKADPELVDKYGRTPLHVACMHGHYDTVKYLLFEMGVDADAQDTSTNHPIHYAAAFGHLRIVRLLVEGGGANPSASNIWRTTPSSVANLKGHVAIVKYLLTSCPINPNFKDQDGRTLLHICAEEEVNKKAEMDQVLLKSQLLYSRQADPNLQTVDGDTVLHTLANMAAFKEHRPAGWAAEISKTRKLTKVDDEDGIRFQKELAAMALNAGAHLEITNSNNETPLATAMRCKNTYMMEFLVENGANFWDVCDEDGNTFFHHLLEIAATLDTLPTRRDIDQKIKDRRVAELERIWAAMKSEQQVNVDAVNNQGYPAIVFGVKTAVDLQYSAVVAEKRLIRSWVLDSNSKTADPPVKKDAVFEFRFGQWMKIAEKIIERYHPDMNATVQLPKDFFKNEPKRDASEYPTETGYGPLHAAAKAQDAQLLSFLLKHGCDGNCAVKVDGKVAGDPPMLMGFFTKVFRNTDIMPEDNYQYREYVEMAFNMIKPDFEALLPNAIQAYLEAGTNPCVVNKTGFSALMKAAKELNSVVLADMCDAIAAHSYNGINERDETSKTALMYALDAIEPIPVNKLESEPSYLLVVYLLLLAKADPNLQYHTDQGDTILMKALRLGIPSLVTAIFENTQHPIDHTATNNKLETMAMVACSQVNTKVTAIYFDMLAASYTKDAFDVNVLDQKGNSALFLAAKTGNEHAVSTLLGCKADPNQVAGPARRPPLSEAAHGAFVPVAQLLLDAGADVNARDAENMTALHRAIVREKYSLVKLLLDRGADVNVVNNYQQTPLHFGIQRTKAMVNASLRIERLLLDAGADINAKDTLGRTPLHIAFIDMDVLPHMKALADTIKKVKKISKDRKADAEIKKEAERVVEKYGHPKATLTNNWIRTAVRKYHETLRKQEQEQQQKENVAPLSVEELELLEAYAEMTWEFDKPTMRKSDPVDIVNFLMRYPSLQCDVADRFGRTPLHYAAAVGAFSSSTMMFARGVDLNATDLDKNTPLQLALLNKHVDYSVMLCNSGVDPGDVMTLPENDPVSTLKYSLAQDFMNMAYVILNKRTDTLELLQDTLQTGKFHVADILMSNASNESLLKTLGGNNGNLWHVLADFTPFDREIWNDYLSDFMDKAHQLGVVPQVDSHGRTAVHYAAKHGQDTLLKHLLHMGVTINALDEDGVTELWYAVNSDRISTAKILLEAGSDIKRGTSTEKKASVLLKATANRNTDMVKLLMSAQTPTDEDSRYGRPNAVMQACNDGSDDILKVLLEGGADPNVPSLAIYKSENEEKRVVVHPVFVASGDRFKILVEAGANTNVVSPQVKPWDGRSCFMSRSKREELMMMLNSNLDVNLKDNHSTRSIFYHYFFAKRDHEDVLNYMLKNTAPDVNEIDPVTGMTPLEHAIREHNNSDVEHLLRLGANPNIASNHNKIGQDAPVDLYFGGPVNAIFHTIAQNDLVILRTICSNSLVPIDWAAVDCQKRTAITFFVSQEYMHGNLDMLSLIISSMGTDFAAIAEMPDRQGKRALDYASKLRRKGLFFALSGHGAVGTVDHDTTEENASDENMDTDSFITMLTVEKDADEEREILEKEKAKKCGGKKHIKNHDDKENKVDSYSGLEKIGRLLEDEHGHPYDIMLQKIDVGSGYYGTNMFYKLSIIYNTVLDVYVLWTRWGRFGEQGMHQKTPFLAQDEAVAEFRSVFRAKSGNVWEDHTPDKFVIKPGRFELIRALPEKKQEILKEFDLLAASAKSELPPALRTAMQVFCNLEALQEAYTKLQLDIPVGRIPQSSIDEGQRILNDIKKVSDRWNALGSQMYSKELVATRKEINCELVQLSNQYYRLFPSTNLTNIRPLISAEQVTAEQARLNNIHYFSFASNVILGAKRRAQEVHPLDYCYRALNCHLNAIAPDTLEHNLVKKYMVSTGDTSCYEIKHLFSVERAGEAERFALSAGRENRKLLWHGSHIHNFLGIMKQGLRVSPATSSNISGSMYGHGIYFADMFSKSINYSSCGAYEEKHPGYAMLLLCEVALGNVCQMGYYLPSKYQQENHQSVMGRGSSGPSKDNTLYDKHGVEIPMGPKIDYQYPELTDYYDKPVLNLNEYIVYDESQVKIRYVVVVRDTQYCGLCQKNTNGEVKPLASRKLDKQFVYPGLTRYESRMLGFCFTRENRSLQHVFDEKLDGYLASEHYRKYWSPAEPLERSTKVCSSCVNKIATFIFVQEATDKLPQAVQDRPVCKFGSDCNSKSNLAHAKKYQHWFHPNMVKINQQEKNEGIDDEDEDEDEDYIDDSSSMEESDDE